MTKPFYLSKTFWFNVLAFLVLVAKAFGFGGFEQDPMVDNLAYVAVVVINIALRFVTNQGVTLR